MFGPNYLAGNHDSRHLLERKHQHLTCLPAHNLCHISWNLNQNEWTNAALFRRRRQVVWKQVQFKNAFIARTPHLDSEQIQIKPSYCFGFSRLFLDWYASVSCGTNHSHQKQNHRLVYSDHSLLQHKLSDKIKIQFKNNSFGLSMGCNSGKIRGSWILIVVITSLLVSEDVV